MRGVNGAVGATHTMSLLVRGGKEVNFTVVQTPGRVSEGYRRPQRQSGPKRAIPLDGDGATGNAVVCMDKDIILKTDLPRAEEVKIPADILVTNAGG